MAKVFRETGEGELAWITAPTIPPTIPICTNYIAIQARARSKSRANVVAGMVFAHNFPSKYRANVSD